VDGHEKPETKKYRKKQASDASLDDPVTCNGIEGSRRRA
jgi:hypothetical protein